MNTQAGSSPEIVHSFAVRELSGCHSMNGGSQRFLPIKRGRIPPE